METGTAWCCRCAGGLPVYDAHGRAAAGVALSGHPKEAVCLRAQTAEEVGYHDDTGPQSTLYCISESVPYFELTGTPGQNWEVRQIGPFRYAVYYGWA